MADTITPDRQELTVMHRSRLFRRRHSRAQRGGTLVESAVTLLVFFIFLFGIIEFGRAYNTYQVATNAAREGARFAVAPCSFTPSSCPYGTNNLPGVANISGVVGNYLSSANVSGSTRVCQGFLDSAGAPQHAGDCTPWPDNGCTTLEAVPTCFTRVQVQAPYRFLFFPFGTVNMTVQANMRNEAN